MKIPNPSAKVYIAFGQVSLLVSLVLVAIFLGIVAILPYLVTNWFNTTSLSISSTGMLIVVGVVLDTMKQLEAQLLMRNYEGFIR